MGFRPLAAFACTLACAHAANAQQAARVHDSTAVDSIRFDQAPLPGGPAAVSRFLFSSVPQWIQIGGVILGAIIAIVVVLVAWRRRRDIITWLTTRSRGTKLALGASLVLVVGIVGAAGAWSWNFMMHENDFCSSCHVMKSAFGRFQRSEHDKLQCHDCHRQSIFASSKELYYWVLDRPEKIPPHAPVPTRICKECHEQERADSTWKRVIATAGHAVHFKSDSSGLKDLTCVSCHAREVHAFKAVDIGCTQSGCHDKTQIKLGAMANQSGLHCITCHDFGRSVAEHLGADSTRQNLVPARQECFTCHQMREKLAEKGLDKDPHKATCGTCHNPHKQLKAGQAFESCATSGCHANADTLTAFHRGLGRHKLDQCGACHAPHQWKVASTNCIGCHRDIYRDRPIALPPRSTDASPAPAAPHSSGMPQIGGPHVSEDDSIDVSAVTPPVGVPRMGPPADTIRFQHSRHRTLACASCHNSSSAHGALTVRTTADCQGCHHAADSRAGPCTACHAAAAREAMYPTMVAMRITGRTSPLQRELRFGHAQHERLQCASCHEPGVSQRVKADCTSCHADHHRAEAKCTTCHVDSRRAHVREAHDGCSGCHTGAGTAALPPARQVCVVCHREQQDHKPGGNCAECHRSAWRSREGSS